MNAARKFMLAAEAANRHFESGRAAVCSACERIGDTSWPLHWIIVTEGFLCDNCWHIAPDQETE